MSAAIRRLLSPSHIHTTTSIYRSQLRVLRPRPPFSPRICHQSRTFTLSTRLRADGDEKRKLELEKEKEASSGNVVAKEEAAQENVQSRDEAKASIPKAEEVSANSSGDAIDTFAQDPIQLAGETVTSTPQISEEASRGEPLHIPAQEEAKKPSTQDPVQPSHDISTPKPQLSETNKSKTPTKASTILPPAGGRAKKAPKKSASYGILEETETMIYEQAKLLGIPDTMSMEMKGAEELRKSLAELTHVEQRQAVAEWKVLKSRLEKLSPDDRQEYIDSMVPGSSEIEDDPLQARTRPRMPPPNEQDDGPTTFSDEQLKFLGLTREDIKAMQGLGGTVDYARAAKIGSAMARAGFSSEDIANMLELDPREQVERLKYGPEEEDDGAIIEDNEKDASVLEWQKRIGISDRKIAYYLHAFGDQERFKNNQNGILDLPLMEAMHKGQVAEEQVAELLEEFGGFVTADMAIAFGKGELDVATLKPLMERYAPELAMTIARNHVPGNEVAKMMEKYPNADPKFVVAYYLNQIPREKADALLDRLGDYAVDLKLVKGLIAGKYTELSVMNWRDKYPGITGDTVAGLVTRDLDPSVLVPLLEKYGPAVITATMMAAIESEVVDEARIAELVNKYPGIWDAIIILRVQKSITAREIRQVIEAKKNVDRESGRVTLGPPVINMPTGEEHAKGKSGKLAEEVKKMMIAKGSELLPKEPVKPISEDPAEHVVSAVHSAVPGKTTRADEMEIARKALAGDGKAIEEMLDLMKRRQELTSVDAAVREADAEEPEKDIDSMTEAELEKHLEPDGPPWQVLRDVKPGAGKRELEKAGLDKEMDRMAKELKVLEESKGEPEDRVASFIKDNKPLVDELTSGKYTDEMLLETTEHLQEKYMEFLKSGKADKVAHQEEMAHMQEIMDRSNKGPMELKDIVTLMSHPSTMSIYKQMSDMGLRIDSSQEEMMAAIRGKYAIEDGKNKYWTDEEGNEFNVFYPRNMEELKKAREAYEAGETTDYMKQTGINLNEYNVPLPTKRKSMMEEPEDAPIKGGLPEPGENEFFADYIGRTTPNLSAQEIEEAEREAGMEEEDIFNYVENPEDPDKEAGGDPQFDSDDLTTMGHGELEQHRELREYARLAAWELPLLHKLKKPFQPPSKKTPLRFRYTTYMGENHPASKKVVLEFDPTDIPGLTKQQTNKLIKLVGPRYNPQTRSVKMSCESFETQAQNKRYLGDLVSKLVNEAQNGKDTFEDVPIDLRHAKKKKVYEFPEEWKLDTKGKKRDLNARKEETAGLLNDYKDVEKSLRSGEESGPRITDGVKIVEGALERMAIREPRAERAPTVLGSRTGTAPVKGKRKGPLPRF